MATEYEVVEGEDGRIIIVLQRACKISKEGLLALISELGIDPAKVTFIEPEDIAECGDLNGAPVIIPLDDRNCDLPELESVGRHCGTSGGRVIVLFGPDCNFKGLHPIADKYGTQCDWSADSLNGCISGGADSPRAATGTLAERPEAHEVKCRR